MNLTSKKSGDNSEEVTPVPISNTVVKLLSADDTWWEAAWESRTLPVFYLPKYFYYIENIAEQYSYITTKVPCEAVLIHERHMRIEISDFVMRAFVPIQRKDSSHAVFFSFGNVSTFRKDGFVSSKNPHHAAKKYHLGFFSPSFEII